MKENTIIFLLIYVLFFPNVILASEKSDGKCSSTMAHLKILKNNSSNPTEEINYPKRDRSPLWNDPFQTFPSDVKLQLIKSALRYEVGFNLRSALQKARSPEEAADLLPPIDFTGTEFVSRYNYILEWIIDHLSSQDQEIKFQIIRAISTVIFKEDPNIDKKFINFSSPLIKQHFDSILNLLLQYKKTGSLPDVDSFDLQDKTDKEKVEDRIKIINQLFAL